MHAVQEGATDEEAAQLVVAKAKAASAAAQLVLFQVRWVLQGALSRASMGCQPRPGCRRFNGRPACTSPGQRQPPGPKAQAAIARLCSRAPPFFPRMQAIPQRSWLAAQLISHFVGPYVEKEVTDTVKELCRCDGWVWGGHSVLMWPCSRTVCLCMHA